MYERIQSSIVEPVCAESLSIASGKFCEKGSVLILVSYVVREEVELTLHKGSVVVEEMQEVERHAQFIYDRNYNRIGSQPRSCTYVADFLCRKKLRQLLHKRKKVKVFVSKGNRKNIISYYFSAFLIYNHPCFITPGFINSCFINSVCHKFV